MKTLLSLFIFSTGMMFIVACGSQPERAGQEPDLIGISTRQFATDSMELGGVAAAVFENRIKCNGSIVSGPNGMARVSAPVGGIVKAIQCYNGQGVQKNQVLLEITGQEIFVMQQDFAEASAGYQRLKIEYERVKALYEERVTSQKDFILAETEYKTAMARYQGLKLRIESIGLSPSKVENGEFYSSYTIKSPIAGNVSNIRASIGSYVDSQSELLEVINPEMLQLSLSVFASDINGVKTGQVVRFRSINSIESHFAAITSIGVAVDSESKSIDCYAEIKDHSVARPIANEFVESEIITSVDTVLALPSEAIVGSEGSYFILVLKKQEQEMYYFSKVEIRPGRQQSGFTEVTGAGTGERIAIKGVYNIL